MTICVHSDTVFAADPETQIRDFLFGPSVLRGMPDLAVIPIALLFLPSGRQVWSGVQPASQPTDTLIMPVRWLLFMVSDPPSWRGGGEMDPARPPGDLFAGQKQKFDNIF